jgi:hypothetical protein
MVTISSYLPSMYYLLRVEDIKPAIRLRTGDFQSTINYISPLKQLRKRNGTAETIRKGPISYAPIRWNFMTPLDR